MNTKQKGQRKETLCANELKKDGYFIAFKSCTVKRGPFFVGLDFGDIFDVIGIKYQDWRFVSCSFASHKTEKIDAVKDFKFHYSDSSIEETVSFEVWLWTPARYRGRGKNKHWETAKWEKIVV